jgi:hypothetical protein
VTEMRDAKHKPPVAAPKHHIDEPKNPATAVPRQANGKFAKGFSGNPAGPKPVTRSRAARLAEQLLESDIPEVCRAVVDAAKAGDMTAAKIIIERLVPPRKDRPITFPLPKLESATDAAKAMAAIPEAVANGELTPMEGRDIAALVRTFSKAIVGKSLGEEETDNLGVATLSFARRVAYLLAAKQPEADRS